MTPDLTPSIIQDFSVTSFSPEEGIVGEEEVTFEFKGINLKQSGAGIVATLFGAPKEFTVVAGMTETARPTIDLDIFQVSDDGKSVTGRFTPPVNDPRDVRKGKYILKVFIGDKVFAFGDAFELN